MESSRPVLLAVLGALAGFTSGFLGIGGGLVLVPVLMMLLRYSVKRAVGTSLATIVLTSLIGVLAELSIKRADVEWRMAIVLTIGSLLGSVLAAKLLRRLPEAPLRALFAASLLVAAYHMVPLVTSRPLGLLAFAGRPSIAYLLTVPVGAVAGVTSTLFGVGGGIVTVPGLSFLFQDVSFHAARATSLAIMMPTALVGAVQHWRMGTVDFTVVRRLVPGALVGVVVGVIAANMFASGPCRIAFAVLLLLTALRLLLARLFTTPTIAVPPSDTVSASAGRVP